MGKRSRYVCPAYFAFVFFLSVAYFLLSLILFVSLLFVVYLWHFICSFLFVAFYLSLSICSLLFVSYFICRIFYLQCTFHQANNFQNSSFLRKIVCSKWNFHSYVKFNVSRQIPRQSALCNFCIALRSNLLNNMSNYPRYRWQFVQRTGVLKQLFAVDFNVFETARGKCGIIQPYLPRIIK